MTRKKVLAVAYPVLFLVLAASPLVAHWEEQSTQVAEGRLLAVDPDSRTLTVATNDGEMTFRYSGATEISGADVGVEGLSGSEGTHVRVHFRSDDLMAEKIEVIG